MVVVLIHGLRKQSSKIEFFVMKWDYCCIASNWLDTFVYNIITVLFLL
jgi:hypothetical protein